MTLAPAHNGRATSMAAAESIANHRHFQWARILEVVGKRIDGLIRQEIEDQTGLSGDTVRPRVLELIDAGKLYETTDTRKTRKGRDAFILVAAHGYAPIRQEATP